MTEYLIMFAGFLVGTFLGGIGAYLSACRCKCHAPADSCGCCPNRYGLPK